MKWKNTISMFPTMMKNVASVFSYPKTMPRKTGLAIQSFTCTMGKMSFIARNPSLATLGKLFQRLRITKNYQRSSW